MIMKSLILCIIMVLLNCTILLSQNDLSNTISKKVGESKDTTYHELQIGTLTYASISNKYVVKDYKKFLYILKIEDIRMKKYFDDIKKEISNEFKKWRINAICLNDIINSNKFDSTVLKSIIEKNEVDGLIIISFNSAQPLQSNGSMFLNMPHKSLSTTTIVEFYDKEFTNKPFIKVEAGADSHYFKPRVLSEKAMANTLKGLIKQNLLLPNLNQ